MTIIQLEYLLAVANCGSFSLAAEHCFVTQPSLSMQVKALEEELGVVLLDRSKKPVIPTEAGEVVLEQARETIKAYNYIKEAVSELKGETAGKLRLGVIAARPCTDLPADRVLLQHFLLFQSALPSRPVLAKFMRLSFKK